MRLSFELCLAQVQVCSACGQCHEDRVPELSMPRYLDGVNKLDAELYLKVGICPACNRSLIMIDDVDSIRRGLRKLGFKVNPIFTVCPPASAALPFDWIVSN